MHTLMSFSELPRHLEPTEDADMLKKVVEHSVATALARRVLPVPGGPYNRMPCGVSNATGQSAAVMSCGNDCAEQGLHYAAVGVP